MRHNVVESFPVTFKNKMIFDDVDALPYIIDFLLDAWKTKLVFGFDERDRKTMLSVEFAMV
jgi:hypothetical protein